MGPLEASSFVLSSRSRCHLAVAAGTRTGVNLCTSNFTILSVRVPCHRQWAEESAVPTDPQRHSSVRPPLRPSSDGAVRQSSTNSCRRHPGRWQPHRESSPLSPWMPSSLVWNAARIVRTGQRRIIGVHAHTSASVGASSRPLKATQRPSCAWASRCWRTSRAGSTSRVLSAAVDAGRRRPKPSALLITSWAAGGRRPAGRSPAEPLGRPVGRSTKAKTLLSPTPSTTPPDGGGQSDSLGTSRIKVTRTLPDGYEQSPVGLGKSERGRW